MRPEARGLRPKATWLLVAATLAACGGAPPARTGPSSSDAVVVVRTNVADAQVWVDGHLLGPLPYVRRGIALDPGHHRLELRRDDYFSRYAELDVHAGQRTELDLPMSPQLP